MWQQNKNELHNQHIATCSHTCTKFYQASLNSFELSQDPNFSGPTDERADGQREGRPIVPSVVA